MPKGHKTPQDLKVFLSSIKSELSDPKNRNRDDCNLPENKMNAMKPLISLQKERTIVIKACDKGAGIMILNFEDYMKACYSHLCPKHQKNNPYYSQVESWEVEKTRHKIRHILKEGLDQDIITKEEHDAMLADKKTSRKIL